MSPFEEEPSRVSVQGDEGETLLPTQWRGLEPAGGHEDDPMKQIAPTPRALGHEDRPLHLIHDAAFQQYQRNITRQRRRRRHNNRFGILIGKGHFVSTSLLITLTFDEESLLSPVRASEADSRLTAIHGKLRRAGYSYRVTSREVGPIHCREHYHLLVDLEERGMPGFIEGLTGTSRGFRDFARDWAPGDRVRRLQEEYSRWVASGSTGYRSGRSELECLAGDYLAHCWGLGYVDAAELPSDVGRCYLLKFAYQLDTNPHGRVRISYSRPASQNWAYGAVPLVYAHEGRCCRYGPRDPLWVSRQAAFLDRKDTFRRAHHGRPRVVSIAPIPRDHDLAVLEAAS